MANITSQIDLSKIRHIELFDGKYIFKGTDIRVSYVLKCLAANGRLEHVNFIFGFEYGIISEFLEDLATQFDKPFIK